VILFRILVAVHEGASTPVSCISRLSLSGSQLQINNALRPSRTRVLVIRIVNRHY
jgi:hypothetical protein